MIKKITNDNRPHYHGHRGRLRKKIIEYSDAVEDYEILEAMLFLSLPRIDTKPIAKNLIKKFGTLEETLAATIDELTKIKGVSESAAENLKILNVAVSRKKYSKVMNDNKPIYDRWADIYEYCISRLENHKVEEFRLIFVNKKNKLMREEVHQTGTINFSAAYPREIIKRALEIGAAAIILLHNHPSGDPTPSRNDINMTEKIIKLANAVEIEIIDHIIVAKKGFTSLKGKQLVSAWEEQKL